MFSSKLKEDEKVHGLEEESSIGRPANRIPFHDLATNEVDVDDLNLDGGELPRHKTRADKDKADADAAGTQQAGTGTLVGNLTPLPPAGGDGQATTPAHEKPGSTSKLPPAQPEVQAATSTGKYRLVVLSK